MKTCFLLDNSASLLLDLFCINNHHSSVISWQIMQVGTEGSLGRISLKIHLSVKKYTNVCQKCNIISCATFAPVLLEVHLDVPSKKHCLCIILFINLITHSDCLQILLQIFLTAAWLSWRYSAVGLFQPLGERADCRSELSQLVLTRRQLFFPSTDDEIKSNHCKNTRLDMS